MDRRSFIKLTAITTSSAALASCGNPENQLIRFVPDEDIVPGIATWKPSVCPGCTAGCGLTVRVMDADREVVRNGQAGVVTIHAAKKLEGSPDHPVNRGALCARGQAAIQITYHPDRITQPLRRAGERGDGRYEAVSWMTRSRSCPSGDRFSAGIRSDRVPGGPAPAIARRGTFLGRTGPDPVSVRTVRGRVLRRRALSFERQQFRSSTSRTRVRDQVRSTCLAPGTRRRSRGAYGYMRKGRRGVRDGSEGDRAVANGANADEGSRSPGNEGVLALGRAQVILANKFVDRGAACRRAHRGPGVAAWPLFNRGGRRSQLDARRVERLARELAETAPAVAIIGGTPLAYTNGLFNALAVNALNALLGSVEQPGGIFFTPQPEAFRNFRLKAEATGRGQAGVTTGQPSASLEAAASAQLRCCSSTAANVLRRRA